MPFPSVVLLENIATELLISEVEMASNCNNLHAFLNVENSGSSMQLRNYTPFSEFPKN